MPVPRFAFGPFILDPENGTLMRHGLPVRIGLRGARLLGALVKNPGEVVTKSTLIDAAWGSLVVEEGNLTVQIASLRKLLGSSATGGDWITTVPRVGYRFSGAVETLDGSGFSLPGKPSIAVLAFENMSGDPEQDYFADGIVEEIIIALSRTRWLLVIPRNSTFAYKGRAVDLKQVGRELGVRYVLEGSVRKAGKRVRITGQLIDTSIGTHLWAERFDGGLEDIFDLQDQITASVVGAIAPKVEQAEIERAQRKPTQSLDAYDYFLRGMAAFHRGTGEAITESLSLFYKAIERDPNFAVAYGMAARCHARRKSTGWVTDRPLEAAEVKRLAQRAASLGWDDAGALSSAGTALAWVVGDLDAADALIDRALVLNPNLATAWLFSGWVKVWLGKYELAIERHARAMRLSPQDPHMFNMQDGTAAAHFFAGRYAEALSWAEMSVRAKPGSLLSTSVAAASAALGGDLKAAEKAMADLRQVVPELRISNLKDLFPIRQAEDLERWGEALRKAGLPE